MGQFVEEIALFLLAGRPILRSVKALDSGRGDPRWLVGHLRRLVDRAWRLPKRVTVAIPLGHLYHLLIHGAGEV